MTTMTTIFARRWRAPSAVTAALTGLAIALAGMGLAAAPVQAKPPPPAGGCQSPADVTIGPHSSGGHLTRGPTTAAQPARFGHSYGGGFFFYQFRVYVSSPDAPGCEATMEFLDLPVGVTAPPPSTKTLSQIGRAYWDALLLAGTEAPLGDATVRARATLGDQVLTLDIPVVIEDAPDLMTTVVATVSQGNTYDLGLLVSTTAENPDPTVVQVSSSHPQVAQVFETKTVPAGQSTGIVTVSAVCRGENEPPVPVTITATIGGNSGSVQITVAGWDKYRCQNN